MPAGATGRIFGVDGTGASFVTGTDQGFIPFDLDHVSPFHRFATLAGAGGCADGIALAGRTAITEVNNIAAFGGGLRGRAGRTCRHDYEQGCRQQQKDQSS